MTEDRTYDFEEIYRRIERHILPARIQGKTLDERQESFEKELERSASSNKSLKNLLNLSVTNSEKLFKAHLGSRKSELAESVEKIKQKPFVNAEDRKVLKEFKQLKEVLGESKAADRKEVSAFQRKATLSTKSENLTMAREAAAKRKISPIPEKAVGRGRPSLSYSFGAVLRSGKQITAYPSEKGAFYELARGRNFQVRDLKTGRILGVRKS